MPCLVKSAHRRGFLFSLSDDHHSLGGGTRGAPVHDPQHRREAAETGESDALRGKRDSGEETEEAAGLNNMPYLISLKRGESMRPDANRPQGYELTQAFIFWLTCG